MGTVPRIGLRRTQAVDNLLQGIWALRPELERKNTTTILLGLEAFLRECKARAHAGHLLPAVVDSVPEKEVAESEPTIKTNGDSTISDDIEW